MRLLNQELTPDLRRWLQVHARVPPDASDQEYGIALSSALRSKALTWESLQRLAPQYGTLWPSVKKWMAVGCLPPVILLVLFIVVFANMPLNGMSFWKSFAQTVGVGLGPVSLLAIAAWLYRRQGKRAAMTDKRATMTDIQIYETAINHIESNRYRDAITVLRQSKKKRCLETAHHLEAAGASADRMIIAGLVQVLRNGLELERALHRT